MEGRQREKEGEGHQKAVTILPCAESECLKLPHPFGAFRDRLPGHPSFVSLMALRPFNFTRIVSRPQQFITVSDIHEPQILEMLKHSINKSNNLLNTKDTVARFEFMIGCGDKMFDNGNNIARNINEHISSGALDELAGLPFNWWNIWSKHVKSRVQRTRRQTDGSGNDEEVEEYYDEEDEGQDQDTELLDTDDDYEANEE